MQAQQPGLLGSDAGKNRHRSASKSQGRRDRAQTAKVSRIQKLKELQGQMALGELEFDYEAQVAG